MIRFVFLIILCCYFDFNSNAQETYTVEIAKNKFVYLIFQDSVKSIDVGSNKIHGEHDAKMVKLIPKAPTGGSESSLFVVTNEGSGYYFLLKEVHNVPEKTVWIIEKEYSSGSLFNTEPEKKEVETPDYYEFNPLFLDAGFDRAKIKEGIDVAAVADNSIYDVGFSGKSIFIGLNYIGYDRAYIYMRFSLQNVASINYNLEFCKFFIASKGGIKKKTEQEDEMVPIAKLIGSRVIEKNGVEEIIFCFEKFTITDNKIFRCEFWEERGDRESILNVRSRYILDAVLQ